MPPTLVEYCPCLVVSVSVYSALLSGELQSHVLMLCHWLEQQSPKRYVTSALVSRVILFVTLAVHSVTVELQLVTVGEHLSLWGFKSHLHHEHHELDFCSSSHWFWKLSYHLISLSRQNREKMLRNGSAILGNWKYECKDRNVCPRSRLSIAFSTWCLSPSSQTNCLENKHQIWIKRICLLW